MPGLVWWHTPNGAKLGGRRSRKGIAIQGSIMKGLGVRAGVSDILAFFKGQFFALELEAPGGRPTEEQLKFISEVREQGGNVCVAEGLDEALRAIETWGLVRGVTA